MQIGNRGNQCQSKAVAGCRSAAREAIRSGETPVILAEGYSGTVVFDGKRSRWLPDIARRIRIRVPEACGRIAFSIRLAEHLRQQLAVAANPHVLLDVRAGARGVHPRPRLPYMS